MSIAVLVAGFLAAAATTYPLWKKKMHRELVAFAVLWSLAFYLGMAQVMHANPPRPSTFIEAIFQPLTAILDRYML